MRRLVVLLLTVVVSAAWAEPNVCTLDSLTRKVEVVYSNPPAQVPCEVIYSKPDEGGTQTSLWNAQVEPGYCEVKAEGLVDQLEGLGWSCTGPSAPATGAEATEAAEDAASADAGSD